MGEQDQAARRTCKGRRRDGQPCRQVMPSGREFCAQHDPDAQSNPEPPLDIPKASVRDPMDVVRLCEDVVHEIRQTRDGTLAKLYGNVGYLLNTALAAMKASAGVEEGEDVRPVRVVYQLPTPEKETASP